MKTYEIKHRFSDKILFSLECKSLKVCVEAAIEARANLSRADLSGADLSGANLSRADLSRAYLSRADLFRADLSRANLSRANLSGADLSRADLSRANLSGADLSGADLSGANLSRADLSRAYLSGVYLSGAYLSGVYLSGADDEKITIKKTPLQILGLRWDIIIFDNHMKIGCEFHAIAEWQDYDDDRIASMDEDALDFWKTNKNSMMAICASNGRA